MLEEIKKKVQQKINNSHSIIVMGVYQNMITSHNDFCGCNYCIILKEYVLYKKHSHKILMRIKTEDYNEYRPQKELNDMLAYRELQKMVKELKAQKDSLKQ